MLITPDFCKVPLFLVIQLAERTRGGRESLRSVNNLYLKSLTFRSLAVVLLILTICCSFDCSCSALVAGGDWHALVHARKEERLYPASTS